MKRYFFIAAVAALAAVSCAKHYEVSNSGEGTPITLSTWNGTLTKAPIESNFAVNEEIDVYGYKWKGTVGEQNTKTNVFEGVEVKQTSSGVWEYAGINGQAARYWDPSFAGYTFYAAYPHGVLATAPVQTGLFVSNDLSYDGINEKLLVAKQTIVENTDGTYANPVELHFMHSGALVDFKFKKHTDLLASVVTVKAFKVSNIQTKGKYTVSSYNASNEPVGSWSLSESPTTNDDTATPYKTTADVPLNAATGNTTATAGALLTNLIVMPQDLSAGAQTFTIVYTIQDASGQVSTFSPAAIAIKQFDTTDVDTDTVNNATITAWQPGYHYTYYITINANKIDFTAVVDSWSTQNGHYYLLN